MKSGSDPGKRSDGDSVKESVKDGEGIDAFRVLQVAAGIVCAILILWLIFHMALRII